jgi:hypothetical protein
MAAASHSGSGATHLGRSGVASIRMLPADDCLVACKAFRASLKG